MPKPQQHIHRCDPAAHRAYRARSAGFRRGVPRPPQPKAGATAASEQSAAPRAASRAATAGGGRPLPGWRSPSGEPCLRDPRGRAGGAPRPALSCGRQHSGCARTRLARAAPPSPLRPPGPSASPTYGPRPPGGALCGAMPGPGARSRRPPWDTELGRGAGSDDAAPSGSGRGGRAAPPAGSCSSRPAPRRPGAARTDRVSRRAARGAGGAAEGKRRRGLRLPWHCAVPAVRCGAGVTAAKSGA